MTKDKEGAPPTAPQGISIWAGGDVRSRNIGPAAGDRHLGTIGGPGLYFFIADNAAGKSHHLRLISKLQREKLLRSDVDITDGQDAAFLQLAAASISFRRLPSGEVADPERAGTEALPQIEELPSAIGALLSAGGRIKGEEPRARARLEALLSYSPIPASLELLQKLCSVLESRAFSMPDPELDATWRGLAAIAQAETPRFKWEGMLDAVAIYSRIAAQPREGVLDDQARLMELLHVLGNSGEKVAEQQGRLVSQAEGRLQQVLTNVARQIEAEDVPGLLLRAKPADPGETAFRRQELAQIRATAAARGAEEDRREQLRKSHSEQKPDTTREAQAQVEAEAAYGAARLALEKARIEASEANGAAHAAAVTAERLEDGAREEYERLDAASVELRELCLVPPGWDAFRIPEDPKAVTHAAANVSEALVRLVTAIKRAADHGVQCRQMIEERDRRNALLSALEMDLESARSSFDVSRKNLMEAGSRVSAWQEVQRILELAIAGPSAADVESAEAALADAESAETLAFAAEAYRQAQAELAAEKAMLRRLLEVASDYRNAARESWEALGAVVTQELALPWLRVEGMRIFILYDGKGPGAKLATAATPKTQLDGRDLDDEERISEAELHEAMLRLMLSRRERLGGILVVQGQVFHPLDAGRLARFSGWAKDAGLVVLSERPRRLGDPEELVLEHVAAAEESVAVAAAKPPRKKARAS